MAETGSGRKRQAKGDPPKAKADKPKERTPTEFVVLRGLKLHIGSLQRSAAACAQTGRPVSEMLGEGAITPQVAWLPVLNTQAEHGPDGEVRVVVALTQDEAIEQITGRAPRAGEVVPEGEGPLPGLWRAVALRSWKGWQGFDPPKQEWVASVSRGED